MMVCKKIKLRCAIKGQGGPNLCRMALPRDLVLSCVQSSHIWEGVRSKRGDPGTWCSGLAERLLLQKVLQGVKMTANKIRHFPAVMEMRVLEIMPKPTRWPGKGI